MFYSWVNPDGSISATYVEAGWLIYKMTLASKEQSEIISDRIDRLQNLNCCPHRQWYRPVIIDGMSAMNRCTLEDIYFNVTEYEFNIIEQLIRAGLYPVGFETTKDTNNEDSPF